MASNVGTIVNWMYNAADKPNDIYWQRMHIDAELLCELTLQNTIRGDSRVYYCLKSVCLYAIDISQMIQTNLSSGRIRRIRRTETPASKYNLQLDIKATPNRPEPAFAQFREIRLTADSAENKKWYDGVHYEKINKDKKNRDFVAKHCRPYKPTGWD